MSISVPEPVAQRGPKDARRHREKQREAIREKLPEIIAEESIITRAKGKTIKIPIRSIEIPNFRSGYRKKAGENGGDGASGGVGVGQGAGQRWATDNRSRGSRRCSKPRRDGARIAQAFRAWGGRGLLFSFESRRDD